MTHAPGDLPPQGHRPWREWVLMRYKDSDGKTVVRPGSPVLFVIVVVVMFIGFYQLGHNACSTSAAVGDVYHVQALRALHLATLDTNPTARQVHLGAASTDMKLAHRLQTGELGCPSPLP